MKRSMTTLLGATAFLFLFSLITSAQSSPPVRQAPDADGGAPHVLVGANALVTDDFLARHTRESGGDSYGDNAVVADGWFDATHKRFHTRSLMVRDIDDPPDIRLGRAPGRQPNGIDFMASHEPGTVVGHVGFEGWNHNGFTSYLAAMQGVVLEGGKMALCLSTATGQHGKTRSGSEYEPNELVCSLAVLPDGSVVIGWNSDPTKPPTLIVRGDLVVDGRIREGGRP